MATPRYLSGGEWKPFIDDTGWVAIDPNGAGYSSSAYVRKIGSVVYAKGYVSRADADLIDGWKPCFIPEGFRPQKNVVTIAAGANVEGSRANFKIKIEPGGTVQIVSNLHENGSKFIYLDGLSWVTD